MPREGREASGSRKGLPGLRRGTVTRLLFLYECTTREVTQLKSVASELGITIQAVSASFRALRRDGLMEFRSGRYRATVAGVAWLHSVLGDLGKDVESRLASLSVVRSSRAVASTNLRRGDRVVLSLHDGVLSASPGRGGSSTGQSTTTVKKGEIAEIDQLEGIVPIPSAGIQVITVGAEELNDPRLGRRLKALLDRSPGLLGAPGSEVFHVLGNAVHRPVVRFGVNAAAVEATRLGVPFTVVVLEEELASFVGGLSDQNLSEIRVKHLRVGRRPAR